MDSKQAVILTNEGKAVLKRLSSKSLPPPLSLEYLYLLLKNLTTFCTGHSICQLSCSQQTGTDSEQKVSFLAVFWVSKFYFFYKAIGIECAIWCSEIKANDYGGLPVSQEVILKRNGFCILGYLLLQFLHTKNDQRAQLFV